MNWRISFLLLALLFAGVRILAACFAAQPALDVTGHSVALAECRAEGKDAGSYAVYKKCADEADLRFGLKDGGL